MDANGNGMAAVAAVAAVAVISKTVWNTTALEAAARDMVDVGIWEVAGQEEREKSVQEMAEAEYRAARANVTQAQTEYTRAICEFMETQARWKTATAQFPRAVPHPVRAANPLEAAETELRRARRLYCLVLDQSQRMQHLLQQTRDAFHQAQELLLILNESAAE